MLSVKSTGSLYVRVRAPPCCRKSLKSLRPQSRCATTACVKHVGLFSGATVSWAIIATLTAQTAHAVDHVSYPYRGVTHIHRVLPGLDVHVVTVDLSSGE